MGQRLAQITLAPADAVATGYAAAQTLAGAGPLILNGALVVAGVGKPDIARRAVIAAVADETGKTFTITGTNRRGQVISEVIKGPGVGLTVISLFDYLTITSIVGSAALAGNVTAGTNQTVSSQWWPVDRVSMNNLGIQVDCDAGVTYTVEQTNDDPFSPGVGVLPPGGLVGFYLTPVPVANMGAKNAQAYTALIGGIAAVRLTMTAFGTGGKATMKLAPSDAQLQ